MNVYIDTTVPDGFNLALIDSSEVVDSISGKQAYKEAEELLPSLQVLFSRNSQSIKTMQEVWVVAGPGRFSATRIGVAISNALSFAVTIPMRTIERNSESETIEEHVTRLVQAQVQSHVEPVYDSAPNITQPKEK